MRSFKLWEAKEWKVQEGESEILHHTTQHNFDTFKPFSHFGTKQAAGARANQTNPDEISNIYSVRLKLGNVARIHDPIGYSNDGLDDGDTAAGYIKNLHMNGHISKNEVNRLNSIHDTMKSEDEKIEHLSSFLRNEKNIHTLSYTNQTEDWGHDSYIITHPSQVRVLRKSSSILKQSDHKYPIEFQGMTPMRNWGKEYK